jgi:Rrf2 family iron-sulfur cluster assembly transcriptional regulator|tara:strand:+ start:1927 stop:2349 length:423 start_codon:yes stop_codon:yes gene_type:complete
MKLSSKGRYAVMALADLATFDPKEPVSLRDISLRQGISLVYLEQLFFKLKKNKVVNSIRGNKGGYTLNRSASEIKISEIFFAVEENVKTMGCEKHSKKGCNGKSAKCITHNLWNELEDYMNNFFEKKKLSDLIKQKENRI